MRAVWYERTGPATEVLTFGEMATPVNLTRPRMEVGHGNGPRGQLALAACKRIPTSVH